MKSIVAGEEVVRVQEIQQGGNVLLPLPPLGQQAVRTPDGCAGTHLSKFIGEPKRYVVGGFRLLFIRTCTSICSRGYIHFARQD